MSWKASSALAACIGALILSPAAIAQTGLPQTVTSELSPSGALPQGRYTLVRTFSPPGMGTAPRSPGRPVHDEDAAGGAAWEAKTFHAAPRDVLPSGARLGLDAGDYVAFIRLKAMESAGGDNVVWLDAMRQGNDIPAASRDVRDRDLTKGRYVSVPFPFHAPGGDVEVRIRWSGYSTLRLDTVAVYRREGGAPTPDLPRAPSAVLSGEPRNLAFSGKTPPGPAPLPRAQPPAPETLVLDIQRMPPDWQSVALSVQGLANRKRPSVYCLQGPNDLRWLRHSRDRGWIRGWKTVSGPRDLLRRFRPLVRGAVVVDPNMPASVNVAWALASVENAVVASPRVAQQLGLPILHDLRGRWKTNVAAYEWAFNRLWPRLNHNVISISHDTHMMPRDYHIQNRVFSFWISGPVDGARPGANPTGEAHLMERLLARMPANIPVLGYPFAGEAVGIQENPGVSLLSRFGKYLIPTDFNSNLSFQSGIRIKQFRQPAPPAPKLWNDKVYVSFIVSDGDNLQVYSRDSFFNLWKSPARGTVPIGWSLSPSAEALIPNVADWFYRNATPADAFVAAVSGIGYMYPDDYADRYRPADRARILDGFLSQTAAGMKTMDQSAIWIMRGTTPETIGRYGRRIPGLKAIFPDYGRQVTTYADATFPTSANVPVFRATTSWAGGTPQERAVEAARQVRAIAPERGPGFLHIFILNWTADIPALVETMRQLGPRFVAVRPEHLGDLYSQWLETQRVLLRLPETVSVLEGDSLAAPITVHNVTRQPLRASLSIGPGQPGVSLPQSARLAPGEPVVLTASGRPRTGTMRVIVREPKGRHEATAAVNVIARRELVGQRPAGRLSFVRHFEAEAMSHGYGERVADPRASAGSAWSSGPRLERTPTGHILFGPYESLSPGRYVAIFRLKRLGAGSGRVATLDLTVYGGRDPIAVRHLTADELPEGEYRSVMVPFDYPIGDMETRVAQTTATPIVVDTVSIFRVGAG